MCYNDTSLIHREEETMEEYEQDFRCVICNEPGEAYSLATASGITVYRVYCEEHAVRAGKR